MRFVRVFFVLLVCFAVLAVAAQKQKIEPGSVEKKTVRVLGDNPWTDTGLILGEKDRVTITAAGTVCFHNGEENSGVGPNGYPRAEYTSDYFQEDHSYCGDPNDTWNHAALIGKDDNGMFLVGSRIVLSGKRGRLWLGINDCSFKEEYHNTGEFRTDIVVARAKKK